MSFLDSIGSFFSGGADKAAIRASQQQAAGYSAARSDIDAGEGRALSYYAPYIEGGRLATAQQENLLGLRGADAASEAFRGFQTTPGYQFAMDEGVRALDRSAAARGGLYSGSTGRSLTRFGQGLANQEFGTYYSRLADLGGQGYGASAASSGVVSGAAGDRANLTLGRANALAGGTINAANARSQGMSNALSLVGKLAGYAVSGGVGGGGGVGPWDTVTMRYA